MLIGIYSDLHISTTSSIMPIYCENSKYTTRLQMIIDTAKWMYKLFDKKGVELILNGGDTMDSHTVKSEEVSALSEFYSYSTGIPEIHIVGNHEILDSKSNFYSDSILDNLDFISVYNKPTKINDMISVLPYMKSEDITNDLLKEISNKILLSHIDIKGSHLRPDYIMDSGVESELLSNYFDLTINGHLHTAEKLETTNGIVWNIGNITSGSFNDNNNYIPSVCILNTGTMEIKRYNNPYAILFRKISVSTISELLDKLNKLNKNYKYILRIKTQYDIKDDVREVVSNNDNVVTYRVVCDMSNYHNSKVLNVNDLDVKMDISKEFIKFVDDNFDLLNYPVNEYISVIKSIE